MILKLAWRNIWRNKRRSIITIASILIAVFLAVFMRSLQLGMYGNMIDNVVGSYAGYVQVHKKGFWKEQNIDNALESSPALLEKIQSIDGVNNIIPRLQSFALASEGDVSQGLMFTGIQQNQENLLTDWNKRLQKGALLSGKGNEIMIAKGVAKIFNVTVGDTMVFLGQGYHGSSAVGKYNIVGIVDLKNPKLNNMNVFADLETAQNFVAAPNFITNLIIDKDPSSDTEALSQAIRAQIGEEQYEVMPWIEMLPELEQMIAADSAGGLVMIFILYMIISFGIFGTVLMMTQERNYEFGVLVSIGMKKGKLMFMMIFETFFLAALGVITGILAAFPLTYYFNSNPIELGGEEAKMIEDMGFDPVIPLSIDFSIPLTHGGIIFIIAIIISIYPIWFIYKMDPIKSMRR